MKASELKKGAVISIEGNNYIVKEMQIKTPSSRSGNTLYKVTYRNVVTKQKFEQTYTQRVLEIYEQLFSRLLP